MFDTWTEHRVSCEYLGLSSLVLGSYHVQITAGVSILSFVCVVAIFIRIGVRPTLFHAFVPFDEISHSGMYDGIGRHCPWVTGSYFKDRLTSTWSAYWLPGCA